MSGIEYKLEKIRLILNNPFNIAHGSSVFRDSIIFTIKYKDYTGYGEAPIVPYYNAEENIITEEIKLSSEKLKSLNFPLEAEYAKSKFLFHSSFAECAFTTALVDILARIRGKRYDEYIGVYTGKNSDKPSLAETSYTISYGSLQDMADAVEKSSYDTIKIKVGFPDDIERLKNILRIITVKGSHSGLTIRLDANQGWNLDEALKKTESLNYLKEEYRGHGIAFEMLEEPLKAPFSDIEKIAEKSSIPVFLDESIKSAKDLSELSKTAQNVAGIVVKTGKAGGPLKTLELIRKARSAGFKVMIGGFIESSLGTTASAFLAAECDFADLDAPLLIKNDPFCGIKYSGSIVQLPSKQQNGCGLGVSKCRE
ncbi:MAG: hypothetical protein J7K04_00455 [Spirochaetales bacterium]|nr:hypothetical protein [Spirochaetales bacterium]